MREQPKYASTHTFAYLLIIFECIKIGVEMERIHSQKNEDEAEKNDEIFEPNDI